MGISTSRNRKLWDEEEGIPEITHGKHGTYEAWDVGATLLGQRDRQQVDAWIDKVNGLLTFSALLLTVITLFIGTSSNSLQPDNAKIALEVLYTISAQLNGTQTVALAEPFESELFDVVQNSFLFASLLLCLISSGLGLWVKEWLRGHMLDLPYCPRERVHVRQYRHRGLRRWRMRQLVATVSFLLQLSVAFFNIGMTLFTLKLNITLYGVLIALTGLWTVLTWVTAFIPSFSTRCPYKSPLAEALYKLINPTYIFAWNSTCCLRRKKCQTMIDRERSHATERGDELELGAQKCIERIVASRHPHMEKDRETFNSLNRNRGIPDMPSDEHTFRLLRIRGDIRSKAHEPTVSQSLDGEYGRLWTAFLDATDGAPGALANVALGPATVVACPSRTEVTISGTPTIASPTDGE